MDYNRWRDPHGGPRLRPESHVPLIVTDTPTPALRPASSTRLRRWRGPLVLSLGLHAALLGVGWALLPAQRARPPTPVPMVAVLSTDPRIEPDPVLDIEELPPLEVVHPRADDRAEPDVPDAALPEPLAPEAPLLTDAAPLRITPRLLQPKTRAPRARSAPVPAPPVTAPPRQAPAPPIQAAPRPTRLTARAVPPVLRYYPPTLRQRGVEGRVVLKVTVSASGYVVDATVLTSSGHAAFDEAATRLVRDTRFAPPGQLAYGKLPVNFRLR